MKCEKRHCSICVVLLASIGLFVILPLCIGLTWIGLDLQNRIDTNMLESNETFIEQIASNTDQLIDIANYATSVLMVDQDTLQNLRTLMDTSDTYEHYRTKVKLSKSLSSLESSVLHAVNGKMALLSSSGYLLGGNGMEQAAEDYDQADWFGRVRLADRKTVFDPGISAVFARLQLDTKIKPYQYLYFGRSILSYSGDYLGMVVVQISTAKLWDRYLDRLDGTASLYLFDDSQVLHVAYCNGSDTDAGSAFVAAIGTPAEGESRHGILGNQYYMAYRLADSPFLLLYTESTNSFYGAGRSVIRSTWGIIIALIILTVTVLILISRYITKPLTALIRNLENQNDGILHISDGDSVFREMNQLVTSYNGAGQRIAELIEQVRTESRLREEANYEVLVSQISPHFLFNTINSIKFLASRAGDTTVAEELGALGEVLHLSYESHADVTTVGHEMHLLSSYVKIMRMRFGNAFQYVDIVPTELYPCEIPAFTLQPIVENAILHGVRDMAAGQIVVSALRQGDDLELSVFNNGETPDKAALKRLLVEEPQVKGKITGIGLNNINRRIKLLYGDAYGLSINENINVGLEICVRIPMRETEGEKNKDD